MKKSILFVILALSVIYSSNVLSASPPSTAESIHRLHPLKNLISSAITSISTDRDLSLFIDIIWTAFAVFLIAEILIKYMFAKLNLFEVVYVFVLLVMTRVGIQYYDYYTDVLWSWSEAIASGIQSAVVGGEPHGDDAFFLFTFIKDLTDGITVNYSGNLLTGLAQVLAGISVSIVVAILSVISFVANMWALYGYALAKIIGLFFIPFLMLKPTQFIFDGWVRFFVGFLIYNILARANLLLTAIALRAYYGLPSFHVDYSLNFTFDVSAISELCGFHAFMFISICALISTGKFAATISSGASGFGGALQTIAMTATRLAK